MTIRAAFAASFRHLMAMATPAIGESFPPTSAGGSGPAPSADRQRNDDGLLLAKRVCLIDQAERERHLRRSKGASTSEAELARVTLECLRRGI